jgi:transposase
MEQFIGCDAHKKFSVFVAVNEKGQAGEALRVSHDRQQYREFLAGLPAHSEIAVEASGHYNWIVDEMERAGHYPKLCNPWEAKRRMGLTNKTDKLDGRGLGILLRNGTLPEVWIPPSELRDQRELLRLRIFLVRLRTRVKNRIHGTLARYNVQIPGADLFGVAARLELGARLPELPVHSREAVEQELATLDFLETQIESAERRLETIMKVSAEADLLKTLPCVGKILSMVMMLEIGRVDRFPTAAHLASYGASAAGSFQRWSHTDGPSLWEREPESEVGVCGDGQLGGDQPAQSSGNSRNSAVSADQTCQESSEGGSRHRPPLGRSGVVGAHQAGSLSRAAELATSSFVDARVSAFKSLAL